MLSDWSRIKMTQSRNLHAVLTCFFSNTITVAPGVKSYTLAVPLLDILSKFEEVFHGEEVFRGYDCIFVIVSVYPWT